MSQPNTGRSITSQLSTGRLPMGWEDEGDNPEANAKRAKAMLKASNADTRKLNAEKKKMEERQHKKEEALARKNNRNNNKSTGKDSKKKSKKNPTNAASSSKDADGAAEQDVDSLLKEIERLRYKNEKLDTAWKRSTHENENLQMGLRRVESQLAGQQEVYDVDVGKLRQRIR